MNRAKELFYLAAIIGGLIALSDHLAHAQAMPSSPHNDNQKFIYMRGDTVFQVESDGVEVALLPVSVDEEMRRGRIIVEIDTLLNSLVYRPKPGHVSISNLYGDSLFVTDSIFVTVHRLNDGRVSQTIKADSTFGALNSENILRDSSHATETIKVWDAAK